MVPAACRSNPQAGWSLPGKDRLLLAADQAGGLQRTGGKASQFKIKRRMRKIGAGIRDLRSDRCSIKTCSQLLYPRTVVGEASVQALAMNTIGLESTPGMITVGSRWLSMK
jgi:hypothetical protein